MRPNWDDVWLSHAITIGQRSRCDAKVGAAIVSPEQRIISSGYAGPPRFFHHTDLHLTRDAHCSEYCPRARLAPEERDPTYRDCPSSHAEANAIIQADRTRSESGIFYVSAVPCFSCAKMISNCGVSRCVFVEDEEARATGRDPLFISHFFRDCGIVPQIAVRPKIIAVEIAASSEDTRGIGT